MSKRNVAYIKPQDPSFLAKLKAQIGPSNEPTIESKKQKLQDDCNSDSDPEYVREDERPQIIVVKSGDLTAAEVEQITKEAAEAPADLNQRVIFRKRKTDPNPSAAASTVATLKQSSKKSKPTAPSSRSTQESKKANNSSSVKLSFNHADDEEDDE